MRKLITAVGIAAALVAVAPAAHAEEPLSCSGLPETPKAYFCIVRFEVGATPYIEPETVRVQRLCLAFDFCVEAQEEDLPMPGVDVSPGALVVVWHDAKCYYVYPNATYVTSGTVNDPSDCP